MGNPWSEIYHNKVGFDSGFPTTRWIYSFVPVQQMGNATCTLALDEGYESLRKLSQKVKMKLQTE
jgi:hypothetical protein